jgi:hypothetical protein
MAWSDEARAASARKRHLKALMKQRSAFKAAGGFVQRPLSEAARQAREDKSDALFAAATKKKNPKALVAAKVAAVKKPSEVKAFDWRLYTNLVQAAHRKTSYSDAASLIDSAKNKMDVLHQKYDKDPAAAKSLSKAYKHLLAYERELNKKFGVRGKHVEVNG